MDEESWNTIIDDRMYYQMIAFDTLKSIGVEDITSGYHKRYYKFKLQGGRDLFVDMNKIPGAWGIILYNGKDVPSLYSSTEVAYVMDSVFNH